jgi:hypothetical protein
LRGLTFRDSLLMAGFISAGLFSLTIIASGIARYLILFAKIFTFSERCPGGVVLTGCDRLAFVSNCWLTRGQAGMH